MNFKRDDVISSLSVSRVVFPTSSIPDYDYLFKVLIIGDSGTGKSSLLLRFCDDYYSEKFISTIGVDFKIKTMEHGENLVKLQVWDSAGQERFRTLTTTYYRGANAIIIVYDICNRASFVNIGSWLSEINRSASENVCIIIVGNKCDREQDRQVEYESAKAFTDRLGVIFIESSAKTNSNVQEIFERIVVELKQRLVKEQGSVKYNNSWKNQQISFSNNLSDSYNSRTKFSCCGSGSNWT